ncbi:hypothetical protein HAN_1g109 (nucleomorph) [Hemiselmis andersenii]|uniref:Uncharacterized protein n=1 Tax=Hemiselmis andersenii TaxID=464988 RepID=A9BKB6_HEMAN|nr:hypothetical protein HAN_1g109 [Hemiselmis andersenii]ABW97949.1 hypothetical protein HAN_1g109 [Hemiselmis andersenii]
MKSFSTFPNILLKKGVNEYLSNLFPDVKIEKRAYQFLNLMLNNFLNKIIQTCSIFIHHRNGEIFQIKDFLFFIFWSKKKNIPNLKFFDKKILKKKKTRKKLL